MGGDVADTDVVVFMHTCNDSAESQSWLFEENTGHIRLAMNTDYCLSAHGEAGEAETVRLMKWSGSTDDEWTSKDQRTWRFAQNGAVTLPSMRHRCLTSNGDVLDDSSIVTTTDKSDCCDADATQGSCSWQFRSVYSPNVVKLDGPLIV